MKKICVITGTRAEFGLLSPLMKELMQDEAFELQTVVTGMHLSPEFGLTWKQIKNSGFAITRKVEMLLSSDTPVGVSKSMALGLSGFCDVFHDLEPDIVVLLGDRYESFVAAAAAQVARIPIAHLHGGETTEGAIDEAFRHSITKMSHLHFTSTEAYKSRVIQLGEHPDRVFNVGAIGVDNIIKTKLLSQTELETAIEFKFGQRNLLITMHPVTLEDNTSEHHLNELLTALDRLKNTKLIFTKANADTNGRIINQMLDHYVAKNKDNSILFTSMGQLNYLSALQFVDAMVGNSSSGILEAPTFKIGTINIGDRQKGRVKAESVIDCLPESNSIQNAFANLFSAQFQDTLSEVTNPYHTPNTAFKIKEILKNYSYKNILSKSFYNLNFTHQ